LDIGGTHHITAALETLCKVPFSDLAKLFNGPVPPTKNSNGKIFIDRDGETFSLMLSYLRNDITPEMV
jgi:hypothetical protein